MLEITKQKVSILGFSLIVLTSNVMAQNSTELNVSENSSGPSEFSLFENLNAASSNNIASTPGARNTPNSRASRNTQATPTFTLVGTSRIGNNTTAVLMHLSGEVVLVPLREGINVVPGHELYSIVSYEAGQVAIQFPASVPCADFLEQGVSCDSTTNVSSLSLTTAEAIAVESEPGLAEASEEAVSLEVENAEQSESARNPFTALRERNREAVSNQATPTTRFQPRRIAPEDVPPGMRVVSTPFGDRLVQQ